MCLSMLRFNSIRMLLCGFCINETKKTDSYYNNAWSQKPAIKQYIKFLRFSRSKIGITFD